MYYDRCLVTTVYQVRIQDLVPSIWNTRQTPVDAVCVHLWIQSQLARDELSSSLGVHGGVSVLAELR